MSDVNQAMRDAIALALYHPNATTQDKKHGAWHHYRDDKVLVSWDDYGCNLDVSVIGLSYPVLIMHLRQVTRYNPGLWSEYLAKLAKPIHQAQAQITEERERLCLQRQRELFAPIDDAAVFGATL